MKKEAFSYILIALILTQGCVVYQKTPVPLNEAHNKGKVLILDSLDTKIKSKNIDKKNGKYYTTYMVRKKGEDGDFHWYEGKYQLEEDKVQVFLKDKGKSTGNTILIIIVAAPLIFIGGVYLFAMSISG